MKCPSCGFELPDNAKFCSACGTKIEVGVTQQVDNAEKKEQEISEYWIQNILSDSGVEFVVGGVKLSYDSNLVTYNNFSKPFRQFEYEQRQFAIDFCQEKIKAMEDIVSYGLDYAKEVEEKSYQNALNELGKVGITLEYDKLMTYAMDKTYDSKQAIEKLYAVAKEKKLDPLAVAKRYSNIIVGCLYQGFDKACEVIYEKGWCKPWLDNDEVSRLGEIAQQNRNKPATLKEVGYEELKVSPYLYAAYMDLFLAEPGLADELIEMATYFGRGATIRDFTVDMVKKYARCFYVSEKEGSVLSVDHLFQYADEGSTAVAYGLERYFVEKYKGKLESHTLTETDIVGLDSYINSGNKAAAFLKNYLLYKTVDQNTNESKTIPYVKAICALAEEKVPAAMAMRGFWGTRGQHNVPKEDALLYLKDAADKKDPTALYWMGDYYLHGSHGAPENRELGNKMINMAAEAGQPAAINALKGGGSSGGCYITTAVCEFQGKSDDCYELTMFRKFRDGWLRNQAGGKELIWEYYTTAPTIVESINRNERRDEIYSDIWERWLRPCLASIEKGDYTNCRRMYVEMVEKLKVYI